MKNLFQNKQRYAIINYAYWILEIIEEMLVVLRIDTKSLFLPKFQEKIVRHLKLKEMQKTSYPPLFQI